VLAMASLHNLPRLSVLRPALSYWMFSIEHAGNPLSVRKH
jgi:hypothetical protein